MTLQTLNILPNFPGHGKVRNVEGGGVAPVQILGNVHNNALGIAGDFFPPTRDMRNSLNESRNGPVCWHISRIPGLDEAVS